MKIENLYHSHLFCRAQDIFEVYSSDDDSQFQENQVVNWPCANTEKSLMLIQLFYNQVFTSKLILRDL